MKPLLNQLKPDFDPTEPSCIDLKPSAGTLKNSTSHQLFLYSFFYSFLSIFFLLVQTCWNPPGTSLNPLKQFSFTYKGKEKNNNNDK